MKKIKNKKSIFALAFIVSLAGINLTSCKSYDPKKNVNTENGAQQNMNEANLDRDTTQLENDKKFEEFRTTSEEKIITNEKIISRLKEDANKVKKENKIRIAELEARNEAMKVKLKEYKREGKKEWQSFKKEFNHDMDELGNALNDLTKDNVK